jgi:hypothetical protein
MREILDIQEQVPSIGEIAARTGLEGGYNFSGDGRPEEWKTVLATGNLFSVLGVPLSYGRRWPARANRDRDFRVILTYGVWRGKFGGSRAVLGRQITPRSRAGVYDRGRRRRKLRLSERDPSLSLNWRFRFL